jgi:DNA-binding NarL/FixJ family response regulator
MHFLIADDHPIFRSGLKALLKEAYPDAKIVECENGKTALAYIQKHTPDIVILDIDMPMMNGLEVLEEMPKNSTTRTIVLTMHSDAEMLRKSLHLGALGYLVKDETTDELVSCIETISTGKPYVASKLRSSPTIQSKIRENEAIIKRLGSLTQTELKTIKLVSEKYSSKEIAELLFVSPKSVENYRSRICKKLELDAKNNALLLWVLENKSLIDDY